MRAPPVHPLLLLTSLCACSSTEARNAPSAAITSPATESAVEADSSVQFLGQVRDPNGLDDLADVAWASDLDGPLATAEASWPDAQGRTSISAVLGSGMHTITLEVTDLEGYSGSDTILLSVGGYPVAVIDSPADGAVRLPGTAITFEATVSDPDQSPDTLAITWEAQLGEEVTQTIGQQPATLTGQATATWTPGGPGSATVTLRVTDDVDQTSTATLRLTLSETADDDADGDSYTPAEGDCDDDDATAYPGAVEVCDGDLEDCGGVVDEKDADNDGFTDDACTDWPGWGVGVEADCNDSDGAIKPGAAEVADNTDNNCDGRIDEGTEVYDDDGDCYCEADTCGRGSENNSCTEILSGDCDDTNADRNPGEVDEPDPGPVYDVEIVDTNCDGIDGNEAASLFVARGATGQDCLKAAPCGSIQAALDYSDPLDRRVILIQGGLYAEALHFTEDYALHGGYDDQWDRGPRDVLAHLTYIDPLGGVGAPIDATSIWVDGAHVTLDNLTLSAPRTPNEPGRDVAVLYADGGSLTLAALTVVRGGASDGAPGTHATDYSQTAAPGGNTGTQTGTCSAQGPAGGAYVEVATCPLMISAGLSGTRSGAGGRGGDCSDDPGDPGSDAMFTSTTAGQGGAAGAICDDLPTPKAGTVGRSNHGSAGQAGSGGTWGANGWTGDPGGEGGLGANGGGGGGGGGSGGCLYFQGSVQTRSGASGGSGGAGGCATSSRGGGGGAGGASVGIFARGTQIDAFDVVIRGGSGGDGGMGGQGGRGQPGGSGGGGGAGSSYVRAGADGGAGGHGGHSGGGGGGAGGPLVGILLSIGASLDGSVQYQAGTPGAGGEGGGAATTGANPGQPGADATETNLVEL